MRETLTIICDRWKDLQAFLRRHSDPNAKYYPAQFIGSIPQQQSGLVDAPQVNESHNPIQPEAGKAEPGQ